jgi:hypothetical protein
LVIVVLSMRLKSVQFIPTFARIPATVMLTPEFLAS